MCSRHDGIHGVPGVDISYFILPASVRKCKIFLPPIAHFISFAVIQRHQDRRKTQNKTLFPMKQIITNKRSK
jgi:hypothetical protein